VKLSNIEFNRNPLSGSGVVTCGQTDMSKLTGSFFAALIYENIQDDLSENL
jgi:hypothetical protein